MKILIADTFNDALPRKLARFGEVTGDAKQLPAAEVVLVRSKTRCTKEYIDGAPRLKLIVRGGVATDNIDKEHAKSKGILVKNTPKASSIAVAELAFALMISIPNRLIQAHESMRQGKWLKKELERTELHGKTLCMIGLGNIGTEIAKRAQAFGMRVVAYDVVAKQCPYAELRPTLLDAIRDADYISLNTPLTDQTKGMISADVIAKMKKGVAFINTSRAKCVVPEAMAAALQSGHVRAYATDVWPSDPPEADYPLLKAPNVIMVPHLGASTVENLDRISDEVVDIIAGLKKEGKL